MSRKIRIFVSSTMKDLADERDAICRRLIEYNYEPVNAEGWTPDGLNSWEKICKEIESADVFLLLIGEKYGWIPDSGPNSGLGLSVTHLEYKQPQNVGLIILPFLKQLEYETDHASQDALKRDAFRKEIKDWSKGSFVATFNLASDLAEKVGKAMSELLSDHFLKTRITKRADRVTQFALNLEQTHVSSETISKINIPSVLIKNIIDRNAILFAGAGISLEAGLPSAAVLTDKLATKMKALDASYYIPERFIGFSFPSIATDIVMTIGRSYLLKAIRDLTFYSTLWQF